MIDDNYLPSPELTFTGTFLRRNFDKPLQNPVPVLNVLRSHLQAHGVLEVDAAAVSFDD